MHALDYIDPGTPVAPQPADAPAKQVTVDIDGFSVTVPDGTSVMRAASQLGNQIPKLCATSSLRAFGSCRLCLVEIEGRKGYAASCTTTVMDGMKIRTQSDKLAHLRGNVLELYLSDHPSESECCSSNNRCELHEMAAAAGVTDSRYTLPAVDAIPAGVNHQHSVQDDSNPYFVFNQDACIVCSRCVRACDEVQGTFALTIEGRGFGSKVSASQSESFLESECVSCGACVESCPTTALTEKSVLALGRPDRAVTTTCAYCGVGCSLKAEVKGEQVIRMAPNRDGHAN